MKRKLRDRIHIVGTTGSGKTTLANNLSAKLGYPHIELDALWWDSDWTNPSVEEFRRRVTHAISGDTWVIDGNYGRVRDIVWTQAQTVIWLDYPLWRILSQLFIRTIRRIANQEDLWNGNRERFSGAFLSRESLFIWALQTYRRRKREYPKLLSQPQHSHLQYIRLSNPHTAQQLIDSLGERTNI